MRMFDYCITALCFEFGYRFAAYYRRLFARLVYAGDTLALSQISRRML